MPSASLRVSEPFDAQDWLWEINYDGFRAMAYIERECVPALAAARRGARTCRSMLRLSDPRGKIVCLDTDGRSNFHALRFCREWPYFPAFDLLFLNGRDLRDLPLVDRESRLARIIPSDDSRVRYSEHVEGRGPDFYRLAGAHDLEGVVGKWADDELGEGEKPDVPAARRTARPVRPRLARSATSTHSFGWLVAADVIVT